MRIICIFLMTFFIVSCASQPIISTRVLTEEEVLGERVKLFWEAKQKNNWDAVKEFVDPDLRKEVIPYLDSQKNLPGMSEIISYNIEGIKIDGGNAMVGTELTIKLVHPLLGSPQIIEQKVRYKWVKRDDLWYIIIVKPDLADFLKKISEKGKGGEN